jgi:hypothetical protein
MKFQKKYFATIDFPAISAIGFSLLSLLENNSRPMRLILVDLR